MTDPIHSDHDPLHILGKGSLKNARTAPVPIANRLRSLKAQTLLDCLHGISAHNDHHTPVP
ncbi:MAG: hypothetical protein MRJ66_17610 [Nitrospira sp.]|nr:hypothetical protein [Nitrospira sp.]